MTFWTSYDTEPAWDHLFLEARPAGADWTTLPDTKRAQLRRWPGHPASAPRQLQTWDGVDNCTATSTTGAWNAASGNSAGWQQWNIDLSTYAGENLEISIGYASDWSAQGVGVFVDDITLPDGTFTSFETGPGGVNESTGLTSPAVGGLGSRPSRCRTGRTRGASRPSPVVTDLPGTTASAARSAGP